MTSLIKNQILKHLSKFAKNLSHDQIHLSALKGEGELKNLELNDEVLTDLLELPVWLRLSKATCNRVAVRIQWTKLKSVPIHLSLDEVRVEVETCEDLRKTSQAMESIPSYASGSAYGFSDKVIDGITVTVNSVILTLVSRVFTASIQISRILVESKSPTWQKQADLRMTRVKDTDKGELLTFKEISWQTVRIEAKSTQNDDLTPLRLITNQARARITIKKKLSDCAVMGCRLVLILDDLLWVLTDDQLKAALHYADSLTGLLKRATEETQKVKGARKLQSLEGQRRSGGAKDQHGKSAKSKTQQQQSACVSAKVFARYDVVETSYHFYSDRIDLHLCDDPGGKGRSCHPELGEGGAFQVSLSQLQIDCYPYHLASAAGDRSSWIRYTPGSVHPVWLENSLRTFQSNLIEAANATLSLNCATSASKPHTPLYRAGVPQTSSLPSTSDSRKSPNDSESEVKNALLSQLQKLMTTNLVVRLNNFSMWKVSTSNAKSAPKEFISGDRERFSLPDDMPVMHFEYTQFYYPGDMEFPLPPPKMFAYFNPIQLCMDHLTVLWLNAFALNLQRSVKMLAVEQTEPPYLDVKIEAIMLRIIFESQEEHHLKQRERPRAMHVQASRILASNYRGLDTGSKADLVKCLNKFQQSPLFNQHQPPEAEFPNQACDIPVLCDKMISHASGCDDGIKSVELNGNSSGSGGVVESSHKLLWPIMRKDLLWNESRDVWHVYLDPLWADFHGTKSSAGRPIPLVDAFPLDIWLYKEPEELQRSATGPSPAPADKKTPSCDDQQEQQRAKMHLLVQIETIVNVQINHYQLLFLMRFLETLGEITCFLTQDVRHILGEDDESSMVLGLTAPQVDACLLMPSGSAASSVGTAGEDLAGPEGVVSPPSLHTPLLDTPETPRQTNRRPRSPSSQVSANTLPVESVPAATISAPVSPSKPNMSATVGLPGPHVSGGRRTPVQPTHVLDSFNNSGPSNIGSPKFRHSQGGSGSSSKKKNSLTTSLSNMMSQLQEVRTGQTTASVPEDDAASFRSDDSGDSEAFVVINQAQAEDSVDSTLFAIHSKRASPVEMASEALASDDLSMSSLPPIAAASTQQGLPDQSKREGVISVATFHLGGLELIQQSIGAKSCIKLRCSSLYGEECPAISWEEFQSKFSSRGAGKNKYDPLPPPSLWCFKLRFCTEAPDYKEMLTSRGVLEATSMSLKEKISRSTTAYINLRAQNLPLQFYMSTLTGIVDLVEDEIIPTPIPMEVHLENIALHLIEDRPAPNVTSPGSLPIDLAIPAMTITRDKTGLFSFQSGEYCGDPSNGGAAGGGSLLARASLPEVSGRPSVEGTPPPPPMSHLDLVRSGAASAETELQQRASLLAVDNANLRTQLEASTTELESLRAKVQELEATQRALAKTQKRVLTMEQENKSLRQTLQYLQQELVKSGKKVP